MKAANGTDARLKEAAGRSGLGTNRRAAERKSSSASGGRSNAKGSPGVESPAHNKER